MDGVPADFDHPLDRAEFARPAHREGVELYRAHIVNHSFAPHSHDGYGVGVIETGGERFHYRGREHLAGAGAIVLMQPGELHTGGPATPQGWRYRMLYLDETVLSEQLGGQPLWQFQQAVRHEPRRAAALAQALARLWAAGDAMAFDSALADTLALLTPLAGPVSAAANAVHVRGVDFAAAVERLHADLPGELRLAELAASCGLSPFHFQRSFKARYHVSAHQWRMALRLAEAKRLLARGQPAAEVAAAVGLADQAHLTRRFAGMYGVTPARYQRQLRLSGPSRPAPAPPRPPSAPRG